MIHGLRLRELERISALIEPGRKVVMYVTSTDWAEIAIEVSALNAHLTPTHELFVGNNLTVRNSGTEDERTVYSDNTPEFERVNFAARRERLRTG